MALAFAPTTTLCVTARPSYALRLSRGARAHPLRLRRARMCADPNAAPAPAPAPPPPTAPPASIRAPAGAYAAAVALGAAKAEQPWWKTAVLGLAAGAYIAAGGLLALCVAGCSPALAAANPGLHKLLLGAVGLPTGLTLVVTAGGDLFTGNTMLLTAAALQRRATARQLFANWALAYIANFAGALLVAAAAVASAAVPGAAACAASRIAVAKCALAFRAAFVRGILCNWLVCLGVYLANASSDFAGKFGAVLIAVTTFVVLGFDHSVANMFFVPLAMLVGAEIGVARFLIRNLLPVTLGNVVGGAVLVAGVYHLAYGRPIPASKPAPADPAPRVALAKE